MNNILIIQRSIKNEMIHINDETYNNKFSDSKIDLIFKPTKTICLNPKKKHKRKSMKNNVLITRIKLEKK